jgi:hypothetical protein
MPDDAGLQNVMISGSGSFRLFVPELKGGIYFLH